MNRRSPFGFDISVSADKRRRAKNRGSSGAFERSSKVCEASNCELTGKYRAPKSPKFNQKLMEKPSFYRISWKNVIF